jgi:hypothetical protein
MFVICTNFVMIIKAGKRRLVGHVGHREEGRDSLYNVGVV